MVWTIFRCGINVYTVGIIFIDTVGTSFEAKSNKISDFFQQVLLPLHNIQSHPTVHKYNTQLGKEIVIGIIKNILTQ